MAMSHFLVKNLPTKVAIEFIIQQGETTWYNNHHMITVQDFDTRELKKLQIINPASHKGDNGKILVVGGSTLFHSASLWAAELAAHFVDHVFYYSPAHINREVLIKSKTEFKNGFIIEAKDLELYIQEADVVLIGPGLRRQDVRTSHAYVEYMSNIEKIESIVSEPLQSYILTNVLVSKYTHKKWVIDAGALQEIELPNITKSCILTPHQQEFGRLFPLERKLAGLDEGKFIDVLRNTVGRTPATWLLKRQGTDYITSPHRDIIRVTGGNEGLIKGGVSTAIVLNHRLYGIWNISALPKENLFLYGAVLRFVTCCFFLQHPLEKGLRRFSCLLKKCIAGLDE